MTDYGAVYAATRDGLIKQARQLSDAAALTIVPSCPEWTVKDVVAHLGGLVADLLGGRRPPLGTPEMTTRQVAERADATLIEICDEWSANADGIAEMMVEDPQLAMGLTADLTTHHHDIAEAIDGFGPAPHQANVVASERYVSLLQDRIAGHLDIALTVTLDDQTWEPAAGTITQSLSAGRVDFMRSVTGRRTRTEVERLVSWDTDAATILDECFLQYGAYRS